MNLGICEALNGSNGIPHCVKKSSEGLTRQKLERFAEDDLNIELTIYSCIGFFP